MRTLCMDSAHKYLVIALCENHEIIASVEKESWKRQSETIFPELMRLMDEVNWSSDDIDEVVITDGPGSYTGVRIAMTIAKVFCARKEIPLYTISTLQLYAGVQKNAFVMLDARSNRAYCGHIHHGCVVEEMILTLDEVKEFINDKDFELYGDCELIDEGSSLSFAKNFIALKQEWKLVENVHNLVPRYLKEQDAYKVK